MMRSFTLFFVLFCSYVIQAPLNQWKKRIDKVDYVDKQISVGVISREYFGQLMDFSANPRI